MLKARNIVMPLVVAGSLWAVGGVTMAPDTLAVKSPSLDFASSSKLWFEGDSTLHPYKATAKTLDIKATLSPAKSVQDSDLAGLEVVIPVKSLKSGEGALDTNMYKAMEAEKYPTIRFVLSDAKVKVSASGNVDVTAKGALTIHGTEKAVTLAAVGELDGEKIRIKGKESVLMSDYGIKPPVLMFGAIKCSDKITVHYDLVGNVN